MKRFYLTILLLPLSLFIIVSAVTAQPSTATRSEAARLAGEVLVNGRALEYVQQLSDRHGSRLTGSPGYNKAAQWANEQFKVAGIGQVGFESFTIPNGWERGIALARLVAPIERPLHIQSLGWAPSTPPEGSKGELILLSDISPEAIKSNASSLKNRIAVLNLAAVLALGPSAAAKLPLIVNLLAETGLKAILVSDFQTNNVLNAFGIPLGGKLAPLPLGQVGMEDFKLLSRLMKQGPVCVELKFENRVTGPIEVNNVVAEIRGGEKPDEWIVVGAHLDAWDYGTGAQDNGAGCAMVLEAARAIAALKTPLRRSIRFVLWGGEELGMLGSASYVRRHEYELKNCVALINTDHGAGRPRGWKVQGRFDVLKAMEPISRGLLAGLGGGDLSPQATFDTDHGYFMLAGVPSLDLWVDMKEYNEVHHKAGDTLDKVDQHLLTLCSAILAVTTYAIAESENRIAPQADRATVEEILKKNKLDRLLIESGIWN